MRRSARPSRTALPPPTRCASSSARLLLGYSYRLNSQRTLSVSLGAGLTRDTPDVTLTVRMPITF